MEFFLERMAPPEYEIREISSETPSGKSIEISEQKVVRHLQCGIVANLQTARSMHEWLGHQLKQIDQAREAAIREGRKGGEGGYL